MKRARRGITVALAVTAGLFGMACIVEGRGGTGSTAIGDTRFESSSLQGTMGSVANFRGTAVMQVSGSSDFVAVRSDWEDTSARQWVMTTVHIDGGLDHPSLQPGAHLVFGSGTRSQSGDVAVTVMGCSGPSHGNYTFDQTTSEVTVDVAAGEAPNTRVLAYSARFGTPTGNSGTVTGTLTYQIP